MQYLPHLIKRVKFQELGSYLVDSSTLRSCAVEKCHVLKGSCWAPVTPGKQNTLERIRFVCCCSHTTYLCRINVTVV